MERDYFIYLPGQTFVRSTVSRVKCLVVAIGTASGTNGPVAVGAGKAGINHDFLQSCSVLFFEESGKGTVSLHRAKVKSMSCHIKDLL
jgi:hypothetical protein